MEVDDLYGLALERFVPERGTLARALRADGRREQATAVAKLRRPSVAAWAVNQIVRTQARGVAALWAAGEAASRAQDDVFAGQGDGQALRAAVEGERQAVAALVAVARGLLSSEGHELSPAIIDRVAETLHAAALDEDARVQVSRGRLERELRHVGLGVGGATTALPAAPRRRPADARQGAEKRGRGEDPEEREKPDKREEREKREDRGKREELEQREERGKREELEQRDERDRVQARKLARSAEAQARRLAERAGRALEVAQERRERAAQALSEADDALTTAQARADAAVDAHRAAQSDLDAASG